MDIKTTLEVKKLLDEGNEILALKLLRQDGLSLKEAKVMLAEFEGGSESATPLDDGPRGKEDSTNADNDYIDEIVQRHLDKASYSRAIIYLMTKYSLPLDDAKDLVKSTEGFSYFAYLLDTGRGGNLKNIHPEIKRGLNTVLVLLVAGFAYVMYPTAIKVYKALTDGTEHASGAPGYAYAELQCRKFINENPELGINTESATDKGVNPYNQRIVHYRLNRLSFRGNTILRVCLVDHRNVQIF